MVTSTLRSSGVTGPTRDCGSLIKIRSTGLGAPSGWSSDTSASPIFNSVITVATSTPGLARNVSAAALTAAWSRGVKAFNLCWTRLLSWAATLSGMSMAPAISPWRLARFSSSAWGCAPPGPAPMKMLVAGSLMPSPQPAD